jgi:hypothetical protein
MQAYHVPFGGALFFKNWSILTHFAPLQRPRGAGNLKFTIYVPLVPKCIISNLKRIGVVAIKKKLKNVQVNRHYTFGPTLRAKPLPRGL